MFLLDTNVVSEVAKLASDETVIRWLDNHAQDELFISAVTVHELRYGIERLPPSRKRAALEKAFDTLMASGFSSRILVLDLKSAVASGKIEAAGKLAGKPIGLGDCMIAGIAIANNATVVTRNVKHFEQTGVKLVNPWSN